MRGLRAQASPVHSYGLLASC